MVCKFVYDDTYTGEILSFILNKWYVNFFSLDFISFIDSCFILTKWYVNLVEALDVVEIQGVLY